MNPSTYRQGRRRRAGAILAGLTSVILLSSATDAVMHSIGVFPPRGSAPAPVPASWAWWLAVGYRCVYSTLGGWIAARHDSQSPRLAAGILAGLGLVFGLIGVIVSLGGPEMGPSWYPWGVALTGPPAVLLGGSIVSRTRAGEEAR